MKTILATIALFGAVVALGGSAQGPMPQPPAKELKAIGWMKGEWDADLKMFEGGKSHGSAKGPASTTESLGGMYLQTKFESDMGGMKMQGLQLTSYDSSKKEYVAYWFDSMGVGVLEMRGKLKGQTLVMSSKMTAFPGMPGKMAFRSTNSMKSANSMVFRLEMNTGKGFAKMLEGTFTRK